MPAKENKTIVLEFYQAFDDRNIEQALAQLAPNFVAHMAGLSQPLDVNEFKQFGMMFYGAFADSQHQFEEVIVEDNKVVTSGTFTARHLGKFQGLPPTGKQIEIAIMHIDRLENGKIVEHWGQGDTQGLMKQLGIMFVPSPQLIAYILKNMLFKFFKISH
ncbi:MAG: ester cyclase [Symploca sp. SIO2D2]|nr:ester cyclase [Symploca sp. SIO2D2]